MTKKCSAEFGTKLKKLKVSDVRKPVSYVGENMVVLSVQTQMKFLKLNMMKYTGFIEFNKDCI